MPKVIYPGKSGKISQKVPTFGVPLSGPPKNHDGAPVSFPVVAIGASAGGLEALTQLVEQLSHDSGMAYVIVQHLDPKHKSMLTELLSRHANGRELLQRFDMLERKEAA